MPGDFAIDAGVDVQGVAWGDDQAPQHGVAAEASQSLARALPGRDGELKATRRSSG